MEKNDRDKIINWFLLFMRTFDWSDRDYYQQGNYNLCIKLEMIRTCAAELRQWQR